MPFKNLEKRKEYAQEYWAKHKERYNSLRRPTGRRILSDDKKQKSREFLSNWLRKKIEISKTKRPR